jgi:hypothetical protein
MTEYEDGTGRAVGPITSEHEFKVHLVGLLLRLALLIKLEQSEGEQRQAILDDIQVLRDYLDREEPD